MGETIAVALVIGSSPQITEKMFSSGDALPAVIVNQFGESTGTYQAALIGMGVVLFFLTLIIGVIARVILARSERKSAVSHEPRCRLRRGPRSAMAVPRAVGVG